MGVGLHADALDAAVGGTAMNQNGAYTDYTSTADAEPERCPKCKEADVYMVFDNVKPEDAVQPMVFNLCGECGHRWKS